MIEESFVLFLTVFFHCFAEVSDSIKTPITARASASPLPTAVAIFGNLEISFDMITLSSLFLNFLNTQLSSRLPIYFQLMTFNWALSQNTLAVTLYLFYMKLLAILQSMDQLFLLHSLIVVKPLIRFRIKLIFSKLVERGVPLCFINFLVTGCPI